MALTPDDENEIDLGISLETVAAVIDNARAVQDIDEDDMDDEEDEDGDESDEASLAALIEDLNEDEQAALIALAWIGRGDYEPEDWPEALKLATERNGVGPSAAKYLIGLDLLGDLLSEGLSEFGIAEEDIER